MKIELKNFIRDIPDFPKPGILFKDITPLLESPKAMNFAVQEFIGLLSEQKIDKIVGIEARGFLFGTLLAEKLGVGFVPIRKPGKLPFSTHKEPYLLEYGTGSLEMHEDAIKKGEKVLLHDDVLATGGTAAAACKLVEKAGGKIVQCNFLLELEFLKGRQNLKTYQVKSLMKF